jgi:hypothetical protein
MHPPKFSVGQSVNFRPRLTGPIDKLERCEIVRLMPSETRDHHYRIKNVTSGVERAVFESELFADDVSRIG